VLERAWEHIDYFSMHYYAGNPNMGEPKEQVDTDSYLASSVHFDEHVDTVAAAIRLAKAQRRSRKDVYLCWDEWNVWYRATGGDGEWAEAPHILEEVYNLEDALVVAQWLGTFLRKADVVKIACIAQIVNVIAPIMTRRDGMFRQTIFYPLTLFSRHAAGDSLDVLVDAPTHETRKFGEVPLLDVTASFDAPSGDGAVFLVNRSQGQAMQVTLNWEDVSPGSLTGAWQMSGSDPRAANSFEVPDAVTSRPIALPVLDGGKVTLLLPPLSFTVLTSRHAPA